MSFRNILSVPAIPEQVGKGFSRFPVEGSVRTNGVSILRGLNLDNCRGFLSPETKQTVSNNEVSMKWVSIRWG